MSGALALDAAWIFAAFLVVVVLAAAGIAARRILLDRGGGTVECGLRRPGGNWRLGVAAYQPDELRWYNGVGVLLRPGGGLHRRSLSGASPAARRTRAEAAQPGAPACVVVALPGRRGQSPAPIELAMGEAALTGFLAWLEAAPPGSPQWPELTVNGG